MSTNNSHINLQNRIQNKNLQQNSTQNKIKSYAVRVLSFQLSDESASAHHIQRCHTENFARIVHCHTTNLRNGQIFKSFVSFFDVTVAFAFQSFSNDWYGWIDRIGNNQNFSIWAVSIWKKKIFFSFFLKKNEINLNQLGTRFCQSVHNWSVCVEQIITSHARFTWHTSFVCFEKPQKSKLFFLENST